MSNPAPKTRQLLMSPRCGAKTRSGGSCRSAAVRGKSRCRMHGGGRGSGGQKGNRNARRHGLFTSDAIAERRQIRDLLGETRKLMRTMR
ncbi:HGGxSTG domain-containing protein [Bradyrhizobium sp.]|jgi:hypothetical protein|uniref:HGGxSTG domain-containing protein n=1 Tax=Bradyrhizobium sp. TaxID=376 RepID=UPI00271DCFAF|nr:HGGxSTG domain-containing protein [Bradyrhizobium sp.]MDO9295374.1 HGGxSTG domain-containing protein [Bradyrhizobium sp.]